MVEHAPKPISSSGVAANIARPARGRWLKRGALLLILLGIGGWFAPAIIATTSLRQQVPRLLFPTFPGAIELGETSLGWMSPVVIANLRARDEHENPLVEVQQFSTSASLWTLATRRGNMGSFKLVEPVMHVAFRDDGSNVEDVIAKFLAGPVSGSPPADVVVEIDNGRVELEHQASHRQSTIDQISLKLVSRQGTVDDVDLAVGNPPPPGHDLATAGTASSDWLAARYGSQPQGDSSSATPSARHAVLRASRWNLGRLGPALARVIPQAEMSGELNADSSLVLTPGELGLNWDWNGSVSIHQLLVAGIDVMKRDRLTLEQVALSGRAAATEGRLAMHDLKIVTDVGEVTATGDIPLDSHSSKSSIEVVQSLLGNEDYHIDGRVDLKKLAALLPQTLRIREGTEITGGDVKVELVGVEVSGVRRWSGVAGIVGLTALNQGQVVPWNKPLAVRVSAHRDQQSIVVDKLECLSDFLQIAGNGTLEDARFTATGDLSKLLENLARFIDLGLEQLSGHMQASGELRRVDSDHVGLTSKISLDDFAYVVSKGNVWREKHLELAIVAAGLTDAMPRLTRIMTGEVHLTSSGDTLDLVLQQPIDLISKATVWSANANLNGNLATWQNRLRPCFSAGDWMLAGAINLSAHVAADSRRVDVSKFELGLQKLAAHGPEWLIQDPEIKFETSGQWDTSGQKWSSPKTTLVGNSLTMRVDNLECVLGKKGISRLTGNAAYRADLKQLSGWKNLAIENPSHYLIGTLSGKANLVQLDQVSSGNIDAQVEKLVVAGISTPPGGQPQWVALWKEPQLKLTGKGSYDGSADKLTLDSSTIDIVGLSVGAKGTLDECQTNQRIDLTGDLAYDWDALVKRFGAQLGENIQLTGKDHRPFSIRGSLGSKSSTAPSGSGQTAAAPVSFQRGSRPVVTGGEAAVSRGFADLNGQAGLGWTSANVYGIVAGPGDISAQLADGVCQFAPLETTVNEGKLHVTPTIQLNRDPFMLMLPAERLIDHVRLSPELCSNWLKFVAPMVADSAQVEGKLSLDLRGAALPLLAPATGTADGTLSIHQAHVQPGGLALQVVGAIEQLQSIFTRRSPGNPDKDRIWLELPEQAIPFKLEQGRMYHEGMRFTVDNVVVKTSGSVGMDETLSVVAEIGIRDEWLGNNQVLAGMKGKSIQIPIGGTLARPQIDPGVFANLARQIGGSAIDGLLQDKVGDKLNGLDGILGNGLDKFLKGKK